LNEIELNRQHGFYARNGESRARLNNAIEIVDHRYRMHSCQSCGLQFADPFQAPGKEWYEIVYNLLNLYPMRRWEFEHLLSCMTPSDRLGEIGCGDGVFLQRCAGAGVPAFGIDFSQTAVEKAKAAGLDVEVSQIGNGLDSLRGRAKRTVVAAFQILEHLDNPAALFQTAASWAEPGAALWVAVPSDRRPSRVLGEHDYLDDPPHHMTRWTPRALAAAGKTEGWRFDGLTYEPLGFQAKLWWLATRHPFYLALKKRRWLERKALEKLARVPASLLALRRTLSMGDRISGQTMLAAYTFGT
jgi:2-polyprenyl-3-methyl-5-hydroxy-6-metoxy-1,4-benzoquinol methylase